MADMGCVQSNEKIMGDPPYDTTLLDTDLDTVHDFPFKKYYWARVLSVYDADTLWFMFKHDNTIFKFKLRLMGIDAPEIRGRYSAEYKAYAVEGRDVLRQELDDVDSLFLVRLDDWDKWGQRVQGDIQLANGDWATAMLIDRRLVAPYSGGTRMTEEEFLAYRQSV